MVGVVAERDDVDAGGEQLVGDLRRDPEAAGDVLAVDDDEVGLRGARAARAAGRGASGGRGRRPRRRRRGWCGASGTAHTLADGAMRARTRQTTDELGRGRARSTPSRRPRPAPARRRPGRRPALDPARRAAAAASSRSTPGPRRGRRAAVLHVAAVIALILNPLVAFLQRRAGPARRWRSSSSTSGCSSALAGVGVAARQPDRRPGLEVRQRRAAHHRRGQRAARRRAGLLRPQGHQRRGQAAGRDARCRRCRRRSSAARRHRQLRRRDAHDARHGRPRADARLRPVGLHAHLRRADRRRSCAR